MTHVLDKDIFPGIAKYPVARWEAEGQPCISSTSWIKICMKIAMEDMDNLQAVFDVGAKLLKSAPSDDAVQLAIEDVNMAA